MEKCENFLKISNNLTIHKCDHPLDDDKEMIIITVSVVCVI